MAEQTRQAHPAAPCAFLFDRSLPLTGGVAHSFLHFGKYRDPTALSLHAIACQGIPPDSETAFTAAQMTAHDIGDESYFLPALRLRRLLKRHRPDVVLCCSLKPYLLARLAALCLKTHVIFWHVAITDILDGHLRTALYRLLTRRNDIIANSEATARAVAFQAHRGRTHIVPLGVPDWSEADRTAPAPRAERPALLGISADALVIAYTASFVAYKRHDILLAAFALLAPEYPHLHLVLIGIGPLRQTIETRAASLPQGRVHFAGARGDARKLLGAIDIYAHPAVGEGFGLAVVEAMLAECPVAAARAGALPELIDDTATGLLCAPADATALAAALRLLLNDAALRTQLGRAARKTALTRFSPQRYAADMTAAIATLRNPRG